MIVLRIIDAVVIVLKENGSLTSKEAYEKIIENSARNELIFSDAKLAIENQRTPLILSERLEHLEFLQEQLKDCA